MAKIFVSVPVMNRPELRMINSLYVSIFHSQHQIQPYFNEQDSLISRARNIHLYKFLYEYPDCEYFMSIDSDLEILNCSIEDNIFDKLVGHDKDFVGGLYACKAEPIISSSVPYEAKLPIFNTGLMRMRWLSSGCWCIKRSAVEKLVKAYPELDYDGEAHLKGKKIHGLYIPFLYDVKKEDFPNIEVNLPFKKYLSEDWAFCSRWEKIGGEIYADTSIALLHTGKRDYNLFNVGVENKG